MVGNTGEGILIELGVDVEEREEIHTFDEYSVYPEPEDCGLRFFVGWVQSPSSLARNYPLEVSHRKKLTVYTAVGMLVFVEWRQYVLRQRPGVRIFTSFFLCL